MPAQAELLFQCRYMWNKCSRQFWCRRRCRPWRCCLFGRYLFPSYAARPKGVRSRPTFLFSFPVVVTSLNTERLKWIDNGIVKNCTAAACNSISSGNQTYPIIVEMIHDAYPTEYVENRCLSRLPKWIAVVVVRPRLTS